MPVELTASTNRSTYFAGESITVNISISNLHQLINRYLKSQDNLSSHNNQSNRQVSPYGSLTGVPSTNKNKSRLTPINNQELQNLQNSFDQKFYIGDQKRHNANSSSRLSGYHPSSSMNNNPNNSNNNNNNIINTSATSSNNDNSERIAWISVYMHCECNVNRNKVAFQNICAALAPVKSVFNHNFDSNNTDISSHLFENDNNVELQSINVLNGSRSIGSMNANQQLLNHGASTQSGGFQGSQINKDGSDSGIHSANSTNSSNSSSSNKNNSNQNVNNLIPKTALAPDRDSSGICVLQTPPQILCCDMTLKAGETRNLVYREKIPVEAPPSYSGSLLKYSYKLTVSVQRVGGSIKQIKLPFRVLVLYGLSDYQGVEEMPINSNPFLDQPIRTIKPSNDVMRNNLQNMIDDQNQTPHSSRQNLNNHLYHNDSSQLIPQNHSSTAHSQNHIESTNQFPTNSEHDSQAHNSNLLDLASDLLNRITAKRRPLFYKIANTNGVVGTFSIPKTSYRLGEDIVGIFDFCGNVPCLQLEISLQMEEVVVDEFKKRSGQPNSITPFHKQISHCLFTKKQANVVPIPLHVSPEFMTEIVILRWRLHFEFVTSERPLEGQVLEDMTGNNMWQGPFKVKTSGMAWDLPIKILPTVPALAEGSVNCEKSATMVF